MKLAILPLDSRPCTYDFPRQLAQNCGVEVAQPPRAIMDFFKTPSRFEDIRAWLLETAPGNDALLLAADQLVYGGLLASRGAGVEEAEGLRRLDTLAALKAACPGLPIYLSSVVMRTTVSTLRAEDQIWWAKVGEYAKLSALTAQDEKARTAAKALRAEIPPQVLEPFLAARRRNHAVNLQAVRLVAQGVAEELTLLQEDSATAGPHITEQRVLLALAAELGVAHRVHLHCGTDEWAAAMAGRTVAQSLGRLPALHVDWLGGERPGLTARYEDRPFAQNLAAYLATCGIAPVGAKEAGVVLLVYAPPGPQQDLAMGPAPACAYDDNTLDAFCARAEGWLNQGKQLALLDVYHANGGESALVERLAAKGLLAGLAGYAAWNTASNSLGTLLGQVLTLPHADTRANQAFTRERLLDDWLYQAVVRGRLEAALQAAGQDRWAIEDTALAQRQLQALMASAPERARVLPGPEDFSARLCWPRTFEVAVTGPATTPHLSGGIS